MSLKKLLQQGKLHAHSTSPAELNELRRIIARDLSDAALQALSEDRRFATAYNAALQTAKMAIACAGYRVGSIPGHHRVSFEAAKLALGRSGAQLADYFDACRRKRNEIDYTGAAIATTTEADEILLHAKSFSNLVESWIASTHPALKA
jgi:uncharacterized protein (UPF0332 family)